MPIAAPGTGTTTTTTPTPPTTPTTTTTTTTTPTPAPVVNPIVLIPAIAGAAANQAANGIFSSITMVLNDLMLLILAILCFLVGAYLIINPDWDKIISSLPMGKLAKVAV